METEAKEYVEVEEIEEEHICRQHYGVINFTNLIYTNDR